MVEQVPETHRHMRVHAGHCTYIVPEEIKFCTPELIRTTCLAGRPEEVIEQVRGMEEAGLNQIILLQGLDSQYRDFGDFSRKVMAKL